MWQWKLSAILFLALVLSGGGAAWASHGGSGYLDVCCAWNGALNDGDANATPDLTFSVSGGDGTDQNTVRGAVKDWETALSGAGVSFEFLEVPATDKSANLRIKLRAGGGVVAGSAKRSFDRKSLITRVDLTISLKAFGVPADQPTLAQVTRHETGHALGLGHTDFPLDLMAPVLGSVATISSCDVNGVKEAQHWRFVDVGVSVPHRAHVTQVNCP